MNDGHLKEKNFFFLCPNWDSLMTTRSPLFDRVTPGGLLVGDRST